MSRLYFDYASSTPCDPGVIAAMQPYFFEQSGNPSSHHTHGRLVRRAIEDSRHAVASMTGANPIEIVFTSGASEANNQAIQSTARLLKHRGRHIIASAIEHHSVLEPLHLLEKEGFELTLIRPRVNGIVDADQIRASLRNDTILVCLVHANNEIGTLQPVEETGRLCRQRGIYFLVDATQTVGHRPLKVQELYCDFLAFSAHKFYGPQGVGALYARQGTELEGFILGGDQERGRRAGTHNTAGIAGLGEALRICQAKMASDSQREVVLRDKIIDTVLGEIAGVALNGDRHQRLANNAHFSFERIKGEDLVSAMDLAGISVSMGSACTWGRLEPSHVLKAIGLTDEQALGSLRVTVGRWTTEKDVDFFLEQLKLKVKQLRA